MFPLLNNLTSTCELLYRVLAVKVRRIGGGGNTSALEWFFKPIHPLGFNQSPSWNFLVIGAIKTLPFLLLHFWVLKSHHSAALKTHRPAYYHRYLKGKASFPFSVSTSNVRTWSGVIRHIFMDGIRTPKCLTRTENSFDKKIKLDRNLECLGQKAVETLQVLGVKKAE